MRHLVIVSWSMKVLCLSRCLELSSYHNHETPRDSVLVYEGVVSLTVPRTILMSQLIRRLVIVSWSMRVLCLSVPRTILMSQLIRRLVIVSWSMRVLCLSVPRTILMSQLIRHLVIVS